MVTFLSRVFQQLKLCSTAAPSGVMQHSFSCTIRSKKLDSSNNFNAQKHLKTVLAHFPYLEIMHASVSNRLFAQPFTNRAVGLAVTCPSLEREVCCSNLGPVKSDTVLPTGRHRSNILEVSVSPAGKMTIRWAQRTRNRLRRNTASITKEMI